MNQLFNHLSQAQEKRAAVDYFLHKRAGGFNSLEDAFNAAEARAAAPTAPVNIPPLPAATPPPLPTAAASSELPQALKELSKTPKNYRNPLLAILGLVGLGRKQIGDLASRAGTASVPYSEYADPARMTAPHITPGLLDKIKALAGKVPNSALYGAGAAGVGGLGYLAYNQLHQDKEKEQELQPTLADQQLAVPQPPQ